MLFSAFFVFALTSSIVATQGPSQAEASSSRAEQPGSQEQEWSILAGNTDGSLATSPVITFRREIYLRLLPEDWEWGPTTDDAMQLFTAEGGQTLERAFTYTVGRVYNAIEHELRHKTRYRPVNEDISLLASDGTVPLAGFWAKSNGISIKTLFPIVPIVPEPTKFIQIRLHEGSPGEWSGLQVRRVGKTEIREMKLQTAKTVYTLNTAQLEEYTQLTEGWQSLYQNPDGRLKTTPRSDWDVFFRLQKDSPPWNLMTDDVIKFSSPEGSTVPERVTIYRLGRIYQLSTTNVLDFNKQYSEVPGKKDVSLVGSVGLNLPLAGIWGRSKTEPRSDTTSAAVAVPTEFIEIRWHRGSPGEWSGWQVRFLKKKEVETMKLQTAKTTYTMSKEEQALFNRFRRGGNRG